MGDITQALRTAQSGLLATQQALDTVAGNISNVNSVGYSRKISNFESRTLAGVGAGVQVSEVTRNIDESLLRSLRLEISDLNAESSQETYYERLQDLFGSPEDNTSISHFISNLTQSLEAFAVSPDKSLEQSDVIRNALDMADRLNEMSVAIQDLRQQADKQIGEAVDEINTLTAKVDTLNDDIIAFSTVNRDNTDLKDQRDQAITELHALVDIRYFSRSDGDVVVFTEGGRSLVDQSAATITHNSAATVTPTTTHAEGDFDGIYVGDRIAGNDITDELRGGKLKGLVDMRDSVLPNLQSQLDELATEMREVVNQIHNRGAPYPGMQSATGSRDFVDPSTQAIRLDPTGSADDVTIALTDSTGAQVEVTTLNTIMTDAGFADRGVTATTADQWHIDDVAATMQSWFRANGAANASVSASTGNFVIALNTTSMNFVFRDETAAANGSTAEDAEIWFDQDGDNTGDETVGGFSYFFGLNDFFTDGRSDNNWDSDVQASSTTTVGAGTLVFEDSTGALTGSPLAVTAGTTLADLATTITNDITNITASVVPDGTGVRLRISHDNGSSFVVSQSAGTILTDIGLKVAEVGTAATLDVREDMRIAPSRLSAGSLQWNADLGPSGEYFMTVGNNDIAESLASTFTSANQFDVSGGLGALNVRFEEYAAAIISTNAVLADNNQRDIEVQRDLVNALQLKSDSISGVNLDEELANLIIFEQGFAAAARVISVIQRMFDALDRAI
jgi:flagellar hook-associated protein 1 FlgK